MRRTLGLLIATASVAAGTLLAAGPAAAAPGGIPGPSQSAIDHASGTSVLFYCPTDPDPAHPGQHLGWSKSSEPSTARRNVGGTCLGPGVTAGG